MRVGFHPLSRLPQPWRKTFDWLFTITLAIVFVLAFEAKVAKPYRIPSSSMEPTLHCARPATGCLGSTDDRVLALRLEYDFESPQRGQIVVFKAPAAAAGCAAGDDGTTFVKRLIGLPGETLHEDDHGFIWIRNPGSTHWVKLKEPYVQPQARLADTEHFDKTWHIPKGEYFMMGDNRGDPATRARGGGGAKEPDRPSRFRLLAAHPYRLAIGLSPGPVFANDP